MTPLKPPMSDEELRDAAYRIMGREIDSPADELDCVKQIVSLAKRYAQSKLLPTKEQLTEFEKIITDAKLGRTDMFHAAARVLKLTESPPPAVGGV